MMLTAARCILFTSICLEIDAYKITLASNFALMTSQCQTVKVIKTALELFSGLYFDIIESENALD